MKIIYNVRFLILTAAIATISFLACKKDNSNKSSDATELLSFGPTGAMPGDTIRFFGNNLDQVTEIDFKNATVSKSSFISQAKQEIHVIVPQATEKGYVTLKTPSGDITSKTQFNIAVTVTVSSITSTARPGADITIKGTYLNWVTSITFVDNKLATVFKSQTQNELVVTVPADAQTGTLVLAYGGTDSSTVETKDTLHVTLPLATSLSPNPVKHQTNLTITGTDLDLVKKVIFNGVSSPVTTFVSQSATQLVVQIPASTINGKVALEAASGVQTTSADDLNILLPAITTMTPNPIDPGTNLTITGTNLDLVTSIAFQNAPAVTTFVSQSANQIVVTAPMGIARGQVTLGVLNSTVTVQSTDILEINGAAPPPAIAFPIYDDAVTNNWTSTGGWTGGGWGGTANYGNTSPVRTGTKSVRIDYVGGYGSPLQLGGASINLAPYTTFKISVYGAPGSGGNTVSIALNSTNNKFNLTVVEGQWTDYVIPLSTLTSSNTLTDIWVQEFSGTGGYTIYVDAIGLN